jgi:hypothetical protein
VGRETRKFFLDILVEPPILYTTSTLPQIAVYHCDIDSLKMLPSNKYQEALSNATAFKHENPEEKTTAAARIYQVNNSSVRTALL